MLLILITQSPSAKKAQAALKLAHETCLKGGAVSVFFYQDGVHVANRFRWQPADEPSPQADWQALAKKYNLRLPVCVGAALARGITDATNAKRHNLTNPMTHSQASLGDGGKIIERQPTKAVPAHNLADGFELVGLGELSELIEQAEQVASY